MFFSWKTMFFSTAPPQVPGPEKCLATVAPLIVRPVQAEGHKPHLLWLNSGDLTTGTHMFHVWFIYLHLDTCG